MTSPDLNSWHFNFFGRELTFNSPDEYNYTRKEYDISKEEFERSVNVMRAYAVKNGGQGFCELSLIGNRTAVLLYNKTIDTKMHLVIADINGHKSDIVPQDVKRIGKTICNLESQFRANTDSLEAKENKQVAKRMAIFSKLIEEEVHSEASQEKHPDPNR